VGFCILVLFGLFWDLVRFVFVLCGLFDWCGVKFASLSCLVGSGFALWFCFVTCVFSVYDVACVCCGGFWFCVVYFIKVTVFVGSLVLRCIWYSNSVVCFVVLIGICLF